MLLILSYGIKLKNLETPNFNFTLQVINAIISTHLHSTTATIIPHFSIIPHFLIIPHFRIKENTNTSAYNFVTKKINNELRLDFTNTLYTNALAHVWLLLITTDIWTKLSVIVRNGHYNFGLNYENYSEKRTNKVLTF